MEINPANPANPEAAEAQTADETPALVNPLPEGQDQVVLVLDLRRVDPDNGDGSSAPDLALLLAGHEPEKLQALSFLLDSVAEVLEFDPDLSHLSLAKVVDFETAGGSISLSEFGDMVQGLAPTPTEIQTEQPIETISDDVDTGNTVAVDSDGVAEVLESETVEPPSQPIPEVIEDIPHDQAPENAGEVTIDELVENGTVEPPLDPAPEGSPVGDSVATTPGPVDPPTEPQESDTPLTPWTEG